MFKLLFLLFVIKWYVRNDIFKDFPLQYLRFSSIFWILLYFFITKKIMTYCSQKVFIPATPFQIISPSLPPLPPLLKKYLISLFPVLFFQPLNVLMCKWTYGNNSKVLLVLYVSQ